MPDLKKIAIKLFRVPGVITDALLDVFKKDFDTMYAEDIFFAQNRARVFAR